MRRIVFIFFFINFFTNIMARSLADTAYWHGQRRELRYKPEGSDFVITNGNRRFTRALYGSNTAFRVEAGDLPEFALYMPGMGGNFKFGLIDGDSSKWLIHAKKVIARYRPGCMIYDIEDEMLGKGKIHIEILALADEEGMIIKLSGSSLTTRSKLVWVFGGASGKKFSRDGDMGPDPESSFYLKPEYCLDNRYTLTANSFLLSYGTGLTAEWDPYVNKNFASDTVKPAKIGKEQLLLGMIPPSSDMRVADASMQGSPVELYASSKSRAPVITGRMAIDRDGVYYFSIKKKNSDVALKYSEMATLFAKAAQARKNIADRIKIVTPDKYINTLGAALSIAADAIWEAPSYLHGSIGWRMRLNGWRGAYTADPLGWHDRARMHFSSYALSQVTSPLTGPVVADTALHLARSLEKMGTNVFSSGYISRNPGGDFRPHHYDMNMVYIDGLLRHFYWTGDLALAKKMWPVLTRHLAWEKRNFDADDNGLYDAYAAIWASDALQYSGGDVTHSSACHYKSNKDAAIIARLIGEDPTPYEAEATKIHNAINKVLWLPASGHYAEFKDLLGNKLLHPNAALWTCYLAMDSDVPDPFQAYQVMRYIDTEIPHIPVRAMGLENKYTTISTTNWMPYDWSLNNVATAEVMHTALANWQAGRSEEAFNLWKAELMSTMYLGGSAGNIGQISFYDAARGEAYRDFADPVAMVSRTLVEGLFGIMPNALRKELTIKPGFPSTWNAASITIPDISFDFKRNGSEDVYTIVPSFQKEMRMRLQLKANGSAVKSIIVNGKKVNWSNVDTAVGNPVIEIAAAPARKYIVRVIWQGQKTSLMGIQKVYVNGSDLEIRLPGSTIRSVWDPQKVLSNVEINGETIRAIVNSETGDHTAFAQVTQGGLSWWQPLNIKVEGPIMIRASFEQPRNGLRFVLVNNTSSPIKITAVINAGRDQIVVDAVEIASYGESKEILINSLQLITGTNVISCSWEKKEKQQMSIHHLINWNIDHELPNSENIDLSTYFNDNVTRIFRNEYLSPRPKTSTLQLPTQGIGDWTHPLKTAVINDSGLRTLAGVKNRIVLPQGIIFETPSDTLKQNIAFTSQWDNYPRQITIPLTGKASHAYLLMAGSTNPMQSRMANGAIIVTYRDNSSDTLLLKNPQNWWPIEQDYMDDGYAFTIDAPRPVRIHLKTGRITSSLDASDREHNGKMIDGGAATVLDIPLRQDKDLLHLRLQTLTNDVVIGLMSLTLNRD
jgi:hypothetical protein